MRAFTLAMGAGKATCERLAPAAYKVSGTARGVPFVALFTGQGAYVDAWICAKRAAFDGVLPRRALVRTGETLRGLGAQ
jgi:hypothetical protein